MINIITDFSKMIKSGQSYVVEMKLEHLLVIMIYCNYDKLQYEFKKTYRINDNGKSHRNYYHLGKYLSTAVNSFGIDIKVVGTFYHGINRKIYLPHYGSTGLSHWIAMYGPLSTTSSFNVALNFATSNGVILKLSPCKFTYIFQCCYDCAWLSDFPIEEYLLAQRPAGLTVTNIIESATGIEYVQILKSREILFGLFNEQPRDIFQKFDGGVKLLECLMN